MKLKSLLLLGALIGATSANAITMADIGYNTLLKLPYSIESVPEYKFEPTDEVASFSGFSVASTEEYQKAIGYIADLNTLNDYQAKTLKALAFSVSFTLQNASSPELLAEFSNVSNVIDVCAFSFPDKSYAFNAMRVITIAIGEDLHKERFLMGSAEQLRKGPDLYKDHTLFDILPYCGEFMGSKSSISI